MYKLVVSPGCSFSEVSKFDCLFNLCVYLYYRTPVHFIIFDKNRRVLCSTLSHSTVKDVVDNLLNIHSDVAYHVDFPLTSFFLDSVLNFSLK